MKLILGMLLAHQAFGCCAWYQMMFFMTCCGDGPTKGKCLAVCINDDKIGGMQGGYRGYRALEPEPPVYYDENAIAYVEDPYYDEPGRVGGMYDNSNSAPSYGYDSAPSYDYSGYGGIGAMKWTSETRLAKATQLQHMHQVQNGHAAPEGTKIENTCLVEHSTTFDGDEEINHKMEIENGAKAVHQYWMTNYGAISWDEVIKAQVEQETGFCVTNVHYCEDGVATTRSKHIRTLLKDCTTSHPGFKAIQDITKPLVSTIDPAATTNVDLMAGGVSQNQLTSAGPLSAGFDQADFFDFDDMDNVKFDRVSVKAVEGLNGQPTITRSRTSGTGSKGTVIKSHKTLSSGTGPKGTVINSHTTSSSGMDSKRTVIKSHTTSSSGTDPKRMVTSSHTESSFTGPGKPVIHSHTDSSPGTLQRTVRSSHTSDSGSTSSGVFTDGSLPAEFKDFPIDWVTSSHTGRTSTVRSSHTSDSTSTVRSSHTSDSTSTVRSSTSGSGSTSSGVFTGGSIPAEFKDFPIDSVTLE